jgi:hypothetical protein
MSVELTTAPNGFVAEIRSEFDGFAGLLLCYALCKLQYLYVNENQPPFHSASEDPFWSNFDYTALDSFIEIQNYTQQLDIIHTST